MTLDYELTRESSGNLGSNGYYIISYDDAEYTLGDVIDYILRERKNEWGTIRCDNYKLEYDCGEIVSGRRNPRIESQEFICAYGDGSWGLMDYKIIVA